MKWTDWIADKALLKRELIVHLRIVCAATVLVIALYWLGYLP